MKNKVLIALLPLALSACYSGNNSVENKAYYYRAYGVFNSEFAVTYNFTGDLKNEIDAFINSFTLEADPYSPHKGVNGVYEINQTNDPVKVSDDLFEAIEKAWAIKSETDGYFNPLIFDLSSLWKKTLFGGIIADPDYTPTEEKIASAEAQAGALLEEMKNSSLLLDKEEKTVQRVGKAKLDLGGIAKGYAVEKVNDLLTGKGVKELLVNGGTSSLGFGNPPENEDYFHVRLKYTAKDDVVRYNERNIYTSTSAVYEQFRIVNGKTYSHVINVTTGLPLTDYSMAFLEGNDSTRLDAYSTACMIAGEAKTKEWEKAYGFKAALFEDDNGVAKLVYENQNFSRA